jgi:hypothetical protein
MIYEPISTFNQIDLLVKEPTSELETSEIGTEKSCP